MKSDAACSDNLHKRYAIYDVCTESVRYGGVCGECVCVLELNGASHGAYSWQGGQLCWAAFEGLE